MRTFSCHCGQRLFFESSRCTQCGRQLGYDPALRMVIALDPTNDGDWQSVNGPDIGRRYRVCANGVEHQICNWLIPSDSADSHCRSCRLNEVIPNLSTATNLDRWRALEFEKRRLLHTLLCLDLSFEDSGGEPPGLRFAFLEDQRTNPGVDEEHVNTGHYLGMITINVAEADSGYLEKTRERLNQPYRTLLGHFRHESGHYFWDRLIENSAWIDGFRNLFGDERADYEQALDAFYAAAPSEDWRERFISAYAQAHPLEDWAECWAHFLHMTDTLETAREFDVGPPIPLEVDFDEWMTTWIRVTVILNELNRSLGMRDPYPFVLTAPVVEKMRFIQSVVSAAPRSSGNEEARKTPA